MSDIYRITVVGEGGCSVEMDLDDDAAAAMISLADAVNNDGGKYDPSMKVEKRKSVFKEVVSLP